LDKKVTKEFNAENLFYGHGRLHRSTTMRMVEQKFLESSIKFFKYYKKLGEGVMAQLSDEQILAMASQSTNG